MKITSCYELHFDNYSHLLCHPLKMIGDIFAQFTIFFFFFFYLGKDWIPRFFIQLPKFLSIELTRIHTVMKLLRIFYMSLDLFTR